MNLEMKILLVDDSKCIRMIEKKILNNLGYLNVDTADDGATALPMLISGNYDFVISDWNMPEMKGIDLLRLIREDKRIGKTPVLLVTADSKQEQMLEAAHAGANDYMVKPINPDIFSVKISSIFSGQQKYSAQSI